MGLLSDILSYVDSRKRVAASNLRDIAQNPAEALTHLFSMPPEEKKRREREYLAMQERVRNGGGLLGLSVMPGVDELDKTPEWEAAMNAPMGLLGAIKVFHGSPHKFDKFDLSKIGTGEGAQAYGWGGYFAENPGTAANYYRQLGGDYQPIRWLKVGNKTVGPHNGFDYSPRGNSTYENIHSSLIEDALIDEAGLRGSEALGPNGVRDFVIKKLDQKIKDFANEWPEAVAPAQQLRNDLVKRGAVRMKLDPASGGIYEANLRWPDAAREAADPLGPQHFLGWDKPLSEQPEGVRKAVSPVLNAIEQDKRSLMTVFPKADVDREMIAWRNGLTGEDLIQSLEQYIGQKSGTAGRYEMETSQRLRDLGIPGIRYLDAGSRNAYVPQYTSRGNNILRDGKVISKESTEESAAKLAAEFAASANRNQTSNYVVFDDALIELLKRNGIPIK